MAASPPRLTSGREGRAEAVRQDAATREKQAYASLDDAQREALLVREKREADRAKLK